MVSNREEKVQRLLTMLKLPPLRRRFLNGVHHICYPKNPGTSCSINQGMTDVGGV